MPSRFSPDRLSLVWHAGEPLAVPLPWLERAVCTLSHACRPGQTIRQSLQTNATLIDDHWIAFFRRHDVAVGVSVDGPAPIHDASRRTRAGGGTFERTMAGIERLKAAGVPFDAIAVVTRDSLAAPDAMFAFFRSLKPRTLGFNVEEIEGPNRDCSLAFDGVEAAWRRFLDRFLALWRAAGAPFALRPVEQLLGRAGTRDAGGNDQNRPLSILTVAVDGSMSTFSPELAGTPAPAFADFRFGNVRDGGPELVLRHPAFRAARARIRAGRRRCARTCGYYGVCGGGAPGNKFFETGRFDVAETLFCRLAVKETVEATLAHLEAERRAA